MLILMLLFFFYVVFMVKNTSLCGQNLGQNHPMRPMSPWDHCKKPKDFEAFDWKEEVAKLSEAQHLALFHSPLGAETEKEEEEDSVDSEVYDADD